MAGKRRYTKDEVAAALREKRGLVSLAAGALGCAPQTVYEYAKKYPEVQQAIDDARDKLVDSAELRLVEAIEKKGEPWAIALVLKTLGKKRGYVERIEQTGADGGPVQHEGSIHIYELPAKAPVPDPRTE